MNDDPQIHNIAESYVRLVLALGVHDTDYVDAYYGASRWREEAEGSPQSLENIIEQAGELRASLRAIPPEGREELTRLRLSYLDRQLEALSLSCPYT